MPHIYENKYQCLNMIQIQCIGTKAHTNITSKREDLNFKRDLSKNDFKKKETKITCFECKKPGHVKTNYPLLKMKQKKHKKKAMVVTWSDCEVSLDEEEEEKEVASFCFMVLEDQNEEKKEKEAGHFCFMALGDKNEEPEEKKEKEATHFCLMGLKNENEEEKDEVSDSCSYNELYDAFESLLGEYKKIGLKNLKLKMKKSVLENETK